MCGRFSLDANWDDFRQWYELVGPAANLEPRYNIAPTQTISVLLLEGDSIRHRPMRWGLIPSWTKDPDNLPNLINARAETAADKPSFRSALRARRALIPASGYYEWKVEEDGQKTPYYITHETDDLMIFAGLWEGWHAPRAPMIESCTILTTAASQAIADVHHRMPFFLDRDQGLEWLSEGGEKLLQEAPQPKLANWPVSREVNNVRNEGSELIRPVETSVEGIGQPKKRQLNLFD